MTLHAILLLVGAAAQLLLSGFMAMLVVFSAPVILGRITPGTMLAKVFDAWIFLLPVIGLLTAGVLCYLAFNQPRAVSHLWHLPSLVVFGGYIALMVMTRPRG